MAPVTPVAPVNPVDPVAPCGIVKLSTAAPEVPPFVIDAKLPAAPVDTVPTETVAATPVTPVAPLTLPATNEYVFEYVTCKSLPTTVAAVKNKPVAPVAPTWPETVAEFATAIILPLESTVIIGTEELLPYVFAVNPAWSGRPIATIPVFAFAVKSPVFA